MTTTARRFQPHPSALDKHASNLSNLLHSILVLHSSDYTHNVTDHDGPLYNHIFSLADIVNSNSNEMLQKNTTLTL